MATVGPHLLGIEGLTREQVDFYLDTAQQFVEVGERNVKKVPALRGKTIINLFLEPSTRTRSSFEIAGKRMSADVINISEKSSSTTKGERLLDTVYTLQSMNPDAVVIRHPSSGAAHFIARHLAGTAVINAGDGLHEHPTQAILDALTLRQRLGAFENLTIVYVGDVLRSRVARSDILLFNLYGCRQRVVAPPTLALPEFEELGVEVHHHMESALEGADVVVSLRMKNEYLKDYFVPNLDEYSRKFIVKEPELARYAPNSVVLAPGPFIRGIEITSEVADGPRSLILNQVNNGVAVRMAALFLLCIGRSAAEAAAGERGSGLDEALGSEGEAESGKGEKMYANI